VFLVVHHVFDEEIVAEEMLGYVGIIDRGVDDRLRYVEGFVSVGGRQDALILKLISNAKFADAIDQLEYRRYSWPARGELGARALVKA
jgi:hypothetical protein